MVVREAVLRSVIERSWNAERVSPVPARDPFWAGVPPYPAPGRPEQPAPARMMSVSSVLVITVCALLTVATVVGGLVLYLMAATEPLGP